jgi:hypothetical protein
MPSFTRENGKVHKTRLLRLITGIVVVALLVFAVWAIRVEVIYRHNAAAINSRNKPESTQKSEPNYNAKPCRMGEHCKGDRDALSSPANAT